MDEDRFLTIRNYEDVHLLVESWYEHRKPKSLCIFGTAGTGKSHCYEERLSTAQEFDVDHEAGDYHLFATKNSALKCYEQSRLGPDLPIVFDDVRKLLSDPDCIDYMKALCQTQDRVVVRWNTNALSDPNERRYISTASVLIILNWIPRQDEDVNAILNRCLVVHFEPTQSEIIKRMRLFCRCQSTVDFLAGLPMLKTLRHLKIYEDVLSSPIISKEKAQALFLAQSKTDDHIKTIVNIMTSKPKERWIDTFVEQYEGSSDAARRQWSRKQKDAREIIESWDCNSTTPCDCSACRLNRRKPNTAK